MHDYYERNMLRMTEMETQNKIKENYIKYMRMLIKKVPEIE